MDAQQAATATATATKLNQRKLNIFISLQIAEKKKIYIWENFSVFCGENVSEERIGYAVMSQ